MKYIKSILAGILGTCLVMNVQAQEIPIVISGGTIHLGNGKLIQNGTIVLNRGKVMEVGDAPVSFIKNAKTIDATGKHIYPGIIALNNIMGLNEIDAVRATRDFNETGDMNPNVRALIAYNTDSKILPTATFNGILFTQCVPQGGNISGTSSLVYTKAWNWEDAAV
ncbi:MAG: amidohydrolase, partial [Bacteroidia bacterium]